jgi:hypothetical protein
MARYADGTLGQQTGAAAIPRISYIFPPKGRQKMIDMNIKDFLETARLYLLGLVPQRQQPALAVIPLHRKP